MNESSSQSGTDTAAASTSLEYRYPGAHSFADTEVDRHRFFGRDKERNEITNKVLSVNLLVLFGKSGLGKTSLLKAGVYPRLRERRMLPLLVRVNRRDADPVTMVTEAIEDACNAQGIEFTHGDRSGLWEYFKTTVFWHDNALWTPVLVLDQFEEIFTLQDATARRAIARELGELVGGGLPERIRQRKRALSTHEGDNSLGFSDAPPEVKLIISLREEYVGTLQEIFSEVPSILSNRVRLAPLAREQAEQAVIKPSLSEDAFRTRPFAYKENALNELLDFLEAMNGQIEPFQLQVLCSHVERRIEREQSAQEADAPGIEVDTGYLGGRQGMKSILKSFYRQAIKTLPGARARRRARRLCEFGLLTQEGFRENLGERRILEEYKLSKGDLEQLVSARLLRREPQHDSFTYELTHDSLTGPVKASRPLRVPKSLIISVIAFAVIAVAAYSYQVWQTERAQEEARRQAEIAKMAEDQATLQAEMAQQIEQVKETTRKAAQAEVNKLIEKNDELASQYNELQISNRDALENLRQRMQEQKNASDEAVASAQSVIKDLRDQLEAQRDQARLAIDKTTQELNREAELQREKLEKTLAEYTARLDKQNEASAKLEEQLKQKVEELEIAAQATSQVGLSILVPEMVRVEAGSFWMGSDRKLDPEASRTEFPRHLVTIERAFEIGKYEVTFDEYDTFALATGIEPPDDKGLGRGQRPVINVSWNDAWAYAAWLSKQTGKQFRLPTEAEWEYAARAGSETLYPWGDEISHQNANYGKEECCGGLVRGRDEWEKTAPVGQFDANRFGLFDTQGNVWEWVEDCYAPNYDKAAKDGAAFKSNTCSDRSMRGGSWYLKPGIIRSASRTKQSPDFRTIDVGFRLARTL